MEEENIKFWNINPQIVLNIFLSIIVIFLIIFLIPKSNSVDNLEEYVIYKNICKLNNSLGNTCNEKVQVESFISKNQNITKNNINDEKLNELCFQLNSTAWGCGDYLIIKNVV